MKRVFFMVVILLMATTLVSAQDADKSSKKVKIKTEIVVYTVDMDCESCLNKIKKELTFAKGVKDLYLNLENNVVGVKFDPAKTDKDKLAEAIKKLGHTVEEQQTKDLLPDTWK